MKRLFHSLKKQFYVLVVLLLLTYIGFAQGQRPGEIKQAHPVDLIDSTIVSFSALDSLRPVEISTNNTTKSIKSLGDLKNAVQNKSREPVFFINGEKVRSFEKSFQAVDVEDIEVKRGMESRLLYGSDQTIQIKRKQRKEKPFLVSITPKHFDKSVKIHFALTEATPIHITIYSDKEEVVAHLVNDVLLAGIHNFTWKPATELPKGTYLVFIKKGNEVFKREVLKNP